MRETIINNSWNTTEWGLSFLRVSSFPLDSSNVFESLEEFETYLKGEDTDKPYLGQLVAVKEEGSFNVYIVQSYDGNAWSASYLVDMENIQQLINDLGNLYTIKGTVTDTSELFALSEVTRGDVYNVEEEASVDGVTYPSHTNFVYISETPNEASIESNWDSLGGSVDLSSYYTKEEINSLISALNDSISTDEVVISDSEPEDADIWIDTSVSSSEGSSEGETTITKVSELENDVGYITNDALDGYAKSDEIPTKVSELENDANYVTSSELESKGYQTEGDCAEAVATAVADLVNSAPETLDTLQEIAEALGNDPNFATTITTLIGNKVDTDTYNSDKATFALKTELPTNTSDLTNDSGYVTDDVLTEYVKSEDLSAAGLSEATSTALGLIRLGSDERQTIDPQPVLPVEDRTYASQLNGDGQLVVNVPWTDTTYGEATTSTAGLMSTADKTKLDAISVSGISIVTALPASPDSNTLYLIVSE